MSENFIYGQDLESMSEVQRQQYLKSLCAYLGVPDNLNLISLVYLDEQDGPARLVAYAKRGAAEAIRSNLGVTVSSLTNQMLNGSVVFSASGIDKNGRQEVAIGSKYIQGLSGTELDDAVMTASTRALRRLSLQFTGTGILDESEVNQRKTIHVSAVPVPAQPIAEPSNTPGKDVTVVDTCSADGSLIGAKITETPITLVDETKRLETIAQLNAQVEPVKKTRKPRSPNKKKVDLGPSEPAAIPEVVKPAEPESATPPAAPVAHPVTVAPVIPVAAPLTAPGVQSKPKLSADQVKPFRQRLFRLQNDYLEPNGFAPTEGMGNAQKMRAFAQVMFEDIVSMNDLSVDQWEKYLSTLENKVESQGPVATIKFIEESIGL